MPTLQETEGWGSPPFFRYTSRERVGQPPAWKDSLAAARDATTAANGTNGATHFYLDAGQDNKPSWYAQGEIEESFGPFTVAHDTNEFQAGEQVDIEIIVSPAPQ